ncbi:MAG: M1 family metallopeptidase [Gemmatimonadota bacterium]
MSRWSMVRPLRLGLSPAMCMALIGLSACAPAVSPAAPPAEPTQEGDVRVVELPPPATVIDEPVIEAVGPQRTRHEVRPVPVPRSFQDALAAGTRAPNGRPGPRYWQQEVAYRIEAELDPASARVNGSQTITYRNNSPDTLTSLVLHLYQNAYRQGAQRVRQVPITGGMRVERVEVAGLPVRAATGGTPIGASYTVDGTLMTLRLPRPLLPGAATSLELDWHFTVPPPGAPRTGHHANEAFVVAQWYPQVAVYDDVRGWDARPYWTNGEFYLEYGDFDVAITVPQGWIVGATGQLVNAEEVLPEQARTRLARAATSDGVVRVITAEDLAAGRTTAEEPGGSLTWRFQATDVRDFAFASSNRYLWDAGRITGAGPDGRPVLAHALYRPEHANWIQAIRYMRHATRYAAAAIHPYIYPQITAAEGPVGGMEYPMLVFITGARSPESLYGVLAHEIAHEWLPMMVGTNESRYAWMDEGFASWLEDRAFADFFPGSEPALATQDSYLRIANSDDEKPSMTEGDLFGLGHTMAPYGIATYSKPGSLLRALGGLLGPETVDAALRTFTERWLLKHPQPWDFFNTVEDVADQELDWFWTPWYFTTAWLDQAIVDVGFGIESASARVVVEDQGTAPMPVHLLVTYADGVTERHTLPVEPWLEGATQQVLTFPTRGRVERVEIDPELWFPDTDRTDNVWMRGGGS